METTAKPIGEILPNILTGIKEPSTKGLPSNTVLRRFVRLAGFQTFSDENLQKQLDAAATFAASINYTEPYWLTLAGKSGVGKTHLAKRVFRQFIDQNRFEVKYDPVKNRIYGNGWAWIGCRKFCSQLRDGAYDLVDYV